MQLPRRRRQDRLVKAVLLLPTEHPGQAGAEISADGLEAEVRSATDGSGRRILPAFTRQHTLVTWGGEGIPYAGLRGGDVLEFFLGGEWEILVVDPGTPYERRYTRGEVEHILEAP